MRITIITAAVIFWIVPLFSQIPQYGSNPYTFSVTDVPSGDFGDHFMAADVTNDGASDYLYRTDTHLHVYDHVGDWLWSIEKAPPYSCNGTSFGVADIDGDGQIEVVLLDNSSTLYILNGTSGSQERSVAISTIGSGLGTEQRGGYIAIANLRGKGDRDLIIQTVDTRAETPDDDTKYSYYINRSLIAVNLEETDPAYMQLWRVNQNRITSDDYYEGYWGQAHGGLFCADVDGDGLDEVTGGTYVDHDGSTPGITGYDESWVLKDLSFIDHIDCITVGDFRPDIAGIEWAITEEGPKSGNQHSVLLSMGGKRWRQETALYTSTDQEPQNIAVGNFDKTRLYSEFWNRSRFSTTQHPWIYDYAGTEYADYAMAAILPDGFNSNGNGEGLEMIWTIDWDGSGKEYIAAKARHVLGHIGIFNAITGAAVWHTTNTFPNTKAKNIFVADVSGDSREEIVIFDTYDNKIKIFYNSNANPYPPRPKWDDPLYRRLKQNWSYYSPGSYTAREPVTLAVDVFLEGPYNGSGMNTGLNGSIPTTSPYLQDQRVVQSIPANVVDWVLVELRRTADGPAVVSRSAFLGSDGRIFTETNSTGVDVFVEKLYDYYVVIRHRNHLTVMSSSQLDLDSGSASWDFTYDKDQYYGGDAADLGAGVYGMYSGDASGNGQVQNDDKNDHWKTQVGLSGYRSADFNLNAEVQNNDKNDYWKVNVGKGTQVSEY